MVTKTFLYGKMGRAKINEERVERTMKAIIFSDSHGRFSPMADAIEAEGKVDLIIHAGDVVRDAEDLLIMYPRIPVAFVRGNNDLWETQAEDERFFTFDGLKIFLTHGHNYGVKYSLAKLEKRGRDLGADICIFGHTHSAHQEENGGVTLFNPGAATRHYGVLETGRDGFCLRICDI